MKNVLVALGLCLLVLLSAGYSLAYEVSEIVVEGTRRVELSAVLPLLSAKPGKSVTAETIDADIQAIFKLGRFEDVTALIEDRNGVKTLIYRVQERPLVRKVEFKGNDEFDEAKLKTLITLKTPDIYEPRVIDQSIKAIVAEYIKEGYQAASVTSSVDVNDRYEATVTFNITEGEKALVKKISFEGNKVFTDKQLKKVMETKERWFLSWLTGRGALVNEVLQNDVELIADEYFNKGYIQVKVHQPVLTLSDDKENIFIKITIDEGDQFRVGQIDIEGDFIRPKEELLSLLTMKPGDIFGRQTLRENILKLNDLYADDGYAYVNVAPLTRIDSEQRLVDLVLKIEKGIQVHIQRINVSGNTKTRDKVIRRELDIIEGDLYSATKMKDGRRSVNNLGFFDTVDVTTSKTADPAVMDIDIAVKERPTGTFTIGAGYSSIDGLIAQGSVTQDNFLGRGLKLNVSGSIGSKTALYNLGVTDPYFLDTKYTVGFDVYRSEREYLDFDKDATGGDIKVGFPIGKDKRAFFIYRYEEKKIYNVDPNASIQITSQEGNSTLSSLSASLSRDTTDYRLDPTRGASSTASAEFAGIGGTEHFAKLVLDHRHFFPAFGDTYFAIHGQIGQIFEINNHDLPIDEKFYLGGISTLRGFDSRTIGPRNARQSTSVDPVTGKVTSSVTGFDYVGGEKEAYFNFEYIFPLVADVKLKGLFFFDIGNAWGKDEDYFSDMRYSAGAGIRWFSPMGPLRLEYGFNLDPKEDETNGRFEFSIGRFF